MISCNELLKLDVFKDIRLIGGKKGIYNNVSWPYICQTLDFSQWVNGGELIFLTGMGMDISSEKIINLIHQCVKNEISGLVILTNSEYIKEIPEEVIKEADKAQLPLFDMPWNIKLIDVTKAVASFIMESRLEEDIENILLQELLYSYEIDEEKIKHLTTQSNIRGNLGVFTAIIHILETIENKNDLGYIDHIMNDLMKQSHINYIRGIKDGKIICVIECKDASEYHMQKEKLADIYLKLSRSASLSLSIGSRYDNIINTLKSYNEAKNAFNLYKYNNWSLDIIDYNKLGFYKLLFEVKDIEKLRVYCNDVLGKIIHHDKSKNTELLETIRLYLINNCNLISTSEEMFIHRNTLIYRLNKIKAILEDNMENQVLKNELMNAIWIYDYLKYIDLQGQG